jgi:DNA-binding transcriptional LysR family regulator
MGRRNPAPDFLNTFVTVVENGSFTRAAKRVHRTQSAVSMQMRRLEESVGRRLFERAGRAIRLTAEGEVFFDHARRILRTYQEAMMAFNRKPLEGGITIGMPDDYARSFLPPILARFALNYPTVRLHIVCDLSRRLNSMLADGSLDLALVTEGEGAGDGIVVHRERLIWATSAHHHVHEQDPVPLAVFHSGDVFRRSAIEQLQEHGRRARVVVTSPSVTGIDAAVEAGIAVACICRTNMRAGLRILTPQEGFPDLPDLGIVLRRAGDEPHELIDRLTSHIIDSFRKLHSVRA